MNMPSSWLAGILLIASSVCAWAEPVYEECTAGGTVFDVITVEPGEVELFWCNAAGVQYRQFRAVQQEVETSGRQLAFITNGGIFEPDGSPSGFLVIGAKELRPVNAAEGKGNFFLKPNGIFFVENGHAGILATEAYLAAPQRSPSLAIQSGPLLVDGGRIHPAFQEDSANRLHRSGIGVNAQGKVVFVISRFGQEKLPNLFEFADFFRTKGCRSALFLDGDISQWKMNVDAPLAGGNSFGAILAVTIPAKSR